MLAAIQQALLSPVTTAFLYRLVRVYSMTFRLTVENEGPWIRHLEGGGKVILCMWHQQFFALIRYFQTYRPYRPSIMISQSRDGELIARIAIKSGWHPVRGSSSKDGSKALRMLIDKLTETGLAAHVVDGPRGPAGKVKRGVLYLAQATGAVIVPVFVTADRAWMFNSWDRFLLPKPLAKVTVRFGDMIRLDRLEGRDDVEKQRITLEGIMSPYLKR